MHLAEAIDGWVQAHQSQLSSSTRRDIRDIATVARNCGYGDVECIDLQEPQRLEIIEGADHNSALNAEAIGQFLAIVVEWGGEQGPSEDSSTTASHEAHDDAVSDGDEALDDSDDRAQALLGSAIAWSDESDLDDDELISWADDRADVLPADAPTIDDLPKWSSDDEVAEADDAAAEPEPTGEASAFSALADDIGAETADDAPGVASDDITHITWAGAAEQAEQAAETALAEAAQQAPDLDPPIEVDTELSSGAGFDIEAELDTELDADTGLDIDGVDDIGLDVADEMGLDVGGLDIDDEPLDLDEVFDVGLDQGDDWDDPETDDIVITLDDELAETEAVPSVAADEVDVTQVWSADAPTTSAGDARATITEAPVDEAAPAAAASFLRTLESTSGPAAAAASATPAVTTHGAATGVSASAASSAASADSTFGELAQDEPGPGIFTAAAQDAGRSGIDWVTVLYFTIAVLCFGVVIYTYLTS